MGQRTVSGVNGGCSKVGTGTTVTGSPGRYAGGGVYGGGVGRGGAGGGFGPAYAFCGSAAVRLVTPLFAAGLYGFAEPPIVGGVRCPVGVAEGFGDGGADGSPDGLPEAVGDAVGVAGFVPPGFPPVPPSPSPEPEPEQAPRARLRPSTTDTVTAPRARMPTTPPLVTSSIRTTVRPGS
ncbi:hypothetical protein ACIGO8_14935 [Streptomyces sp. NPDC053493]|uniref:hypothetical protein n=1 Tax=Streptomyces sp. NPDC053493 TaxID=3365705 RepID=UPI0037D5DBE4